MMLSFVLFLAYSFFSPRGLLVRKL